MNQEDVLRAAMRVGLVFELPPTKLLEFAALVAAHEREECAKMAEAFHRHGYDFTGDAELHEAIRSRT